MACACSLRHAGFKNSVGEFVIKWLNRRGKLAFLCSLERTNRQPPRVEIVELDEFDQYVVAGGRKVGGELPRLRLFPPLSRRGIVVA